MRNWFKKSNSPEVQSNNDLIQEIHTSFETEVDYLLEFSKEVSPAVTDKQHLIDKHKRLSKLGFTHTSEGSKAKEELQRLSEVERDNKEKEKLHKAINYFSFAYPQYKFITEDSVNKICKKYGLVFGDVSYYIGDVPEKNLEQIERFKIKEKDECWESRESFMSGEEKIFYCSKKECEARDLSYMYEFYKDYFLSSEKSKLKIVASVKDFDTSRMEIKGYELKQIPDPIVLQPVIYENERYFLVVTAWGLETQDVVNEKLN